MKSLLTLVCMLAAAAAFAIPAKEARIDCLNVGQGTALKVADKGTAVRADTPKWLATKNPKANLDYKGALAVFTIKGTDWQTGTVTFTAVGDGKLNIQLMGPDVRDPQTKKRIEARVDFQKVVVNGKTVFEAKDGKTVWHDGKHFIRNIEVKDGETIKIEVTFRPSAE